MPEIFRESASYYVLGFEPAYTGTDGKFRRISVRVNRRDILLQARRGYYAPGRPAPRLPELGDDVPLALSGAVAGPLASHQRPTRRQRRAGRGARRSRRCHRRCRERAVRRRTTSAADSSGRHDADVAARWRVRSHGSGRRARPPSTRRRATGVGNGPPSLRGGVPRRRSPGPLRNPRGHRRLDASTIRQRLHVRRRARLRACERLAFRDADSGGSTRRAGSRRVARRSVAGDANGAPTFLADGNGDGVRREYQSAGRRFMPGYAVTEITNSADTRVYEQQQRIEPIGDGASSAGLPRGCARRASRAGTVPADVRGAPR